MHECLGLTRAFTPINLWVQMAGTLCHTFKGIAFQTFNLRAT